MKILKPSLFVLFMSLFLFSSQCGSGINDDDDANGNNACLGKQSYTYAHTRGGSTDFSYYVYDATTKTQTYYSDKAHTQKQSAKIYDDQCRVTKEETYDPTSGKVTGTTTNTYN